MTKRRKFIRRVYEQGHETTVSPASKKAVLKKKTAKAVQKTKKPASLRKVLRFNIRRALGLKTDIPQRTPVKRIKAKSRVQAPRSVSMPVRRRITKNIPPVKAGTGKTRITPKKNTPVKPAFIKEVSHESVISKVFPEVRAAAVPTVGKHEFKYTKHLDEPEIKDTYNKTTLCLLAKDPYTMYAYWEISQDDLSALEKKFGRDRLDRSRRILRVYDVTFVDFTGNNANSFFDIEVGTLASNWYINLWCDNVSYLAQLGLVLPEGEFHPIVRSNHCYLPKSDHSQRTEQIWMKVTDSSEERPYVMPTITEAESRRIFGDSFTEMALDLPLFQAATHGGDGKTKPSGQHGKAMDISAEIISRYKGSKKDEPQQKRRRIYLTEDDIRRYYAKFTVLLRNVLLERCTSSARSSAKTSLTDSYIMSLARRGFILEGESAAYKKIIFSRLFRFRFYKRFRTGASEEMVLMGGSENLMSSESLVASESLLKGSESRGDLLTARMKRRDFFFELNTELIVYGRTEPDAEVWLGTRKITLNPDGTFSMRFGLPDGHVPLEFTAISADKIEKRGIFTYVDRNTKTWQEYKDA